VDHLCEEFAVIQTFGTSYHSFDNPTARQTDGIKALVWLPRVANSCNTSQSIFLYSSNIATQIVNIYYHGNSSLI
jgi:hypothetical protein